MDIPIKNNSRVLESYMNDPNELSLSPEKRKLALKVWYKYNVCINLQNRIWNDLLKNTD